MFRCNTKQLHIQLKTSYRLTGNDINQATESIRRD